MARSRRWFRPRYSLATLFVVVTVFGIWLGVQVKWIHDRRKMIANFEVLDSTVSAPNYNWWSSGETPANAPGSLWLFGEHGITFLRINIRDYEPPRDVLSYEVVHRARRLFPEAKDVTIHTVEKYGRRPATQP